jgi:hypothetical protein
MAIEMKLYPMINDYYIGSSLSLPVHERI